MRSVQLAWAPDWNQPANSTIAFASRPITDRPFPYWSRIYTRASGANAVYNSMQTEFNHRFRKGLTLDSAWTWAKNLSDGEGPVTNSFALDSGGGRVTNSYCRACDWGNVGPTRRHRWTTTSIYELPFGRGKRFGNRMSSALNAIAGGWRASGILLAQTGPYLTATFSGGDPSGTNGPTRGSQRPDVVLGMDRYPGSQTADQWLSIGAFVCPGRTPGASNQFNCNVTLIGRFGNGGAGTLLGPGSTNLSLGLAKDFRIRERATLKFQGTFTNLPNHPNLSDPGTDITSLGFGRITTARGADSGGNRVGQFALRLEF